MGDKYFKGSNTNPPNWQALESPNAKRHRGGGWMKFRRIIISRHQMMCDNCGATLQSLWAQGKTLDVHHKVKLSEARHLRFEESNCMVLCQPCHIIAEKPQLIPGSIADQLERL